MSKKYRNANTKTGQWCFVLFGIFLVIFAGKILAADKNTDKQSTKSKAKSVLSKSQASIPASNQRILVRFKEGSANATKSALHRTLGSRVKRSLKSVPGLQVIETGAGKDADNVLKQYQKDPSVLYAEPDYRIKLKAVPNDTSFSQLWALNNTGQTGGVPDADINAPEAWDITRGSNSVIVAVVDTGVDYTHEDLAANIWTNPGEIPNDGIDNDGNGYIDDIHGIDTGDDDSDPMDDTVGHGTHVAGTIGARGNNSLGVTGVNWAVTIIGCKIFTSSAGQELEAFVSGAVECLDYLYDLKMNRGIDITATNNSWGWIGNPSQTLMDAIDRQRQAGILFIAAAGNDSLDNDKILDNPSSYYIPNVISVAASNHTDILADFSNYGRRTVHVAAPGEEILSTIPGSLSGGTVPPNPYEIYSGTSMASPHVVGLLALLKAQDSSRDWIELKNLLISSGTLRNNLAETTVGGRRIRAYDFDNTGGMSCVDQTVLSRLQPRTDEYGIAPGELVGLSMLHINCGEPAGNVSVTIYETGDTVTLLDNGSGYDQVAGDGIYSAQIDMNALGLDRATILFPDSTTVYARYVYNYLSSVSIPYQWRDITSAWQSVIVGDDETGYVNTPFDINFGNNTSPYTKLAIDTNGYIILQRTNDPAMPVSIFENFEIPFSGLSNLVAPFWDDLFVDGASNLIWGVTGISPNRELVVTWQNVRPYAGSQGITFQVVFPENSSDVIVNYQDLVIPDQATDLGVSATVGVQVSSLVGRQHSYNSAVLSNNSSLRWSMPTGVVNTPEIPQPIVAPVANAGPDQSVDEGDIVTLSGSGTDSDGTITGYSWNQISGDTVILNNANTAIANFTAPEVNSLTPLEFELTVTDNDGITDTDQVMIEVSDVPPPNVVPLANAGLDQIVNENDIVTLSGSGTDSDGTIVAYSWNQLSGDTVVLNNADTATASFTAPAVISAMPLAFELTVTDDDGATDTDQVIIVVNDSPPPNAAPQANAGLDQSVEEGAMVTLHGSGTDSDGTIVGYSWNQISGDTVALNNPGSATASFTAPEVDLATSLRFELTVTDDDGVTDTDQVTVVVNDAPPPAAAPTPADTAPRGGGGGGGSFGIFFGLLVQLVVLGRLLNRDRVRLKLE